MSTSDAQVMRSLMRDDAYHVERVLAERAGGRTELVTLDGEGPMVRKRIPAELANAGAWATLMNLSDPLLPAIEEIYRMPDELVVVYDYVPGESVRQLVERKQWLAEAEALSYARDLCHAAGVLHDHGVVHRDITPGNVIVHEGRAHLIDLGIARQGTPGQDRDTHVLGTWGFAAPEQYGFQQTDARSDVFSIGRLLGYMLTGIPPADERYAAALADARVVAPDTAALVAATSAFEPSARPQSAAALAQALETLAYEHGVQGFSPQGADALGVEEADRPLRETQSTTRRDERSQGSEARAQGDAVRVEGADDLWAPRASVSEVSPLVLALGVAGWLACLGWDMLMVLMIVSTMRGHVAEWSLTQIVMALITMAGSVLLALEIYRAVMHRGRYAYKRVRFGALLFRILIILALTFVIMMFIGIAMEI